LAAEVGCSPLLAQCLLIRGFDRPEAAAAFLEPRLRDLADPFLLPDMAVAVARLWRAREQGERLVIFGDYDVDGVTATAILLEVLRPLGWHVETYLPHRLEEGYGLTREAAENCLQRHPSTLLLAVDCGSTAGETVAWLRQRGVSVIVLDHHQVSVPCPPADAIINPRRDGDAAPRFAEFCSAGLAFKLGHALVKEGRQRNLPAAQATEVKSLLDLVALGTIADLVPITGENRILVSTGLARLNRLERPGLRALHQVAQIAGAVGTYEVGFRLAPRLNAAGRLETATDALELLLATDGTQAEPLARALDERNRERQNLERALAEEVGQIIRASFKPEEHFVIVEGQAHWHLGVVGIVASRVLQEFHRPTIIMGGDGEQWRGSGRSVEGFDLAAALRECDDLLLRHGGHALAAGVTLPPNNLAAFRQRLNLLAREHLGPEQLRPRLRLDAAVALADLTQERVEELGRLQPCGAGNPTAQFVVRDVRLQRASQPLGREQQHLKLWVTDGAVTLETLWWGRGDQAPPSPEGSFDLACVPQLNHFNQRTTVQLRLLDWQPRA
jgi:single-stranded-DNA-specific exonuclease